MRRRPLLAAPLAAVPLATSPRAEVTGAASILVELFTSQGCSSCPSADRQLARLADRPGVVAVAFHVTYWDNLGWKDTLGDERFTRRQHAYARRLGTPSVYTPQLMVQGEVDLVGSDPRLEPLLDELARTSGAVAAVPMGDERALLPRLAVPARTALWAAAWDAHHRVAIPRGENAGLTLDYRNAARDYLELGSWDGASRAVGLPLPAWAAAGRVGAVLVAQDDATGRILAMGTTELGPSEHI